jgi:hypothetical protein
MSYAKVWWITLSVVLLTWVLIVGALVGILEGK